MAYITREDGEHFVIPSYRDVLTAKNKNALKKEILLLSQNYGEYITLQRKNPAQYEVAFSPEPGYLLGESIWHYFKRPEDMIYCEAVPNTTEAILVIVKAGSVYLDGSFPLESIPEELVIFLTQQNNFEIYTYGDVPISETPEEGKFSFDASSVKSFTTLDQPVFPSLPLYKFYQLQLVDQVLRAQGIGVFPLRQLLAAAAVIALLWLAWSYLATEEKILLPQVTTAPNPYQVYNNLLTSAAPDQEIKQLVERLSLLNTMPGWMPDKINYTKSLVSAMVKTPGSSTKVLFDWAKTNGAKIDIKQDGVYVLLMTNPPVRMVPSRIYPINQVMAELIDRLSVVYPGNHLQLSELANAGVFSRATLTFTFSQITPIVLALIGEQFKELPLVLHEVNLTAHEGTLTGTITLEALGN